MEMGIMMIRVQDTARYDLYSSQNGGRFGSVVLRPDLSKGFVYISNPLSSLSNCLSFDFPKWSEFEHLYSTKDGLDVYGSDGFSVSFNRTTHEIVKETISVPILSSSMISDLSFTYRRVDYSYVHEDDPSFNINENKCTVPSTNATTANTLIMCPVREAKPALPGCAFEFDAKGEEMGEIETYNVKVMTKDGENGFLKLTKGDFHVLVRCDKKSRDGLCLLVREKEGTCDLSYDTFDSVFPFSGFLYRGQPEDTECLDSSSSGCKKYCNEDRCIALDSNGLLIRMDGFNITYKDSIPSVEDFTGVLCNGTALEAPEAICPSVSSSSESQSHASSRTSSHSSSHASSRTSSHTSTGASSAASSNSSTSAPVSSASSSLPFVLVIVVAVLFILF